MSSVIKAGEHTRKVRRPAFNFDDMAAQAENYLAELREKAKQIVLDAQQQADSIRKQAEQQGKAAGLAAAEKIVEEKIQQKVATLMPALKNAVNQIENAKQAWLQQWESNNVRLAVAIAERVIRRELSQQPEVTLSLVREALQIAAQGGKVVLRLNPQDHQTLGRQVEAIVKEVSRLAEVEVTADQAISPGGCVAETRFGSIDEQIESQLARIEAELL